MERLICVLIGYAFGLFQTGFIYGKLHHIDIRDYGSGNAGSTNTLRTLGKKAGIITFLGDCFKCVFAIVLVKCLFAESCPDMLPLLGLYAGAGAILGHNFPFYLKFRGGKGIAATVGLLIATNIVIAAIAAAAFFIIMYSTKYVSVGSIAIVVIFAIGIIIYGQMGGFGMAQAYVYEMDALAVGLAILAIYRHKANIIRLMNGTENKIGKKKEAA